MEKQKKYSYREIKWHLDSLTRADNTLKNATRIDENQRAELETQFCQSAGWFLFHGITVKYVEEAHKYKVIDANIVDSVIPVEDEDMLERLQELQKKRQSGFREDAILIDNQITQLKEALTFFGYHIEDKNGVSELSVRRHKFNSGKRQ
jgi:hypothetical protein